jgi:trigger factor
MEVSITDINEVEKEIHIHATADELIPHFEKAYRKQLPKIEIKGFRKGKAPLDLVKKIHGEAIEYNSLDSVASDMYRQVAEERHIHPIGEPVLTDIDYKRGETLSFKIKYEIKPTIELKEYTNIPVEKVIHTVTEKEVQDEILRLRKSNSVTADADSVTDDEHVVTADIQQVDEAGSPLIGKKTPGAKIYLADESLFPEIKQALRNVTVGMTTRATVEVERNEQKEKDHLELTTKKIEKINLPEFNDEFIKKVTKERVTTVDEFTKQLRTDLEQYWNERTDRKLIDALIGEIVRKHDFMVPDSLVKGVLDSLIEELKNRYPDKKLPKDFKEEEFREKNRGYAVFQAKWYLIRERIIDTQKFTVDDADLVKLAEVDAPKMGIEKDRLLTFYRSSDAVKDKIVSEKLMEFLKHNAKITEKVTEEFFE